MPNIENDIKRIAQFLEDAKTVLSDSVSKKDDLFTSQLNEYLPKAWSIIEKKIDKFIDGLKESRSQEVLHFAPPYRRIYENFLGDIGLTGDELSLKLSGFYEAYGLWNKIKKNNLWGKMPWKKLLKNLFEWINVILSSLSFVSSIFLPNQNSVVLLADPIREFKDAIEAGMSLKDISEGIP